LYTMFARLNLAKHVASAAKAASNCLSRGAHLPSSVYVASTGASSAGSTLTLSAGFHSTRVVRGLEEFFTNQQPGRTGRPWTCADLRNKSFEDLQKLWFVLLKERNMLATYKNESRRTQTPMKNRERIAKVRASMRAIKVVLRERTIEYRYAIGDKEFIKAQNQKKLRRYRERLAMKKRRDSVITAAKLKPWNPNNLKATRKRKFSKLTPRTVPQVAEDVAATAAQ